MATHVVSDIVPCTFFSFPVASSLVQALDLRCLQSWVFVSMKHIAVDKRDMHVLDVFCMVITYSKGKDQRVRLPILLVVIRTGNPCLCLRIWSRGMGSAVPSRISQLISILRLNLLPTYGVPLDFRGGVHLSILSRHTPSGQSRVYRVMQLRTDGVHCRESAGTGLVNLKVGLNWCCLGRSPWTN